MSPPPSLSLYLPLFPSLSTIHSPWLRARGFELYNLSCARVLRRISYIGETFTANFSLLDPDDGRTFFQPVGRAVNNERRYYYGYTRCECVCKFDKMFFLKRHESMIHQMGPRKNLLLLKSFQIESIKCNFSFN